MVPYIALMRPRQWVKNLLIFTPAFFAGTLFASATFGATALAFVAFSLLASATYIANDVLDCEEDRRHPRKCLRPLPSGRARIPHALVFALILLIAAFVLASLVPGLLFVFVLYLALNAAYSLLFRRVAVVDITVVAAFYVLRVLAGGVAAGLTLSPWIILATFFLALFIVAGKRFGEQGRSGSRKTLGGYAKETLPALFAISAALALASYGLWAVFVHPSSLAVYSTIPVAAVLLRTMNTMYKNPEEAETPEIMLFTDPWILGVTALWGLSMWFLLYV